MERYGFALPMDEAEAKVLIDFGGRNWIVWNAEFKREKIGEMPTEMFFHFFKSFSDAAKCNLNIECKGENEHHKIEAIFKAFAKAIRMAVKRDPFSNYLPSTKGVLYWDAINTLLQAIQNRRLPIYRTAPFILQIIFASLQLVFTTMCFLKQESNVKSNVYFSSSLFITKDQYQNPRLSTTCLFSTTGYFFFNSFNHLLQPPVDNHLSPTHVHLEAALLRRSMYFRICTQCIAILHFVWLGCRQVAGLQGSSIFGRQLFFFKTATVCLY